MMKDADAEVVRKYVEAAESQYRGIADPRHLYERPHIDFMRTPIYYYRVGLLLSALEAGYHDILEFGAGACWLGAILYRLGSRMTFMDVSKTALKIGKKFVETLPADGEDITPPKFVAYDGFTFPFPDESFDRIISNDAFHHVPNPVAALKEMYRVLRPGGRIVFNEPGEGHGDLASAKQDMKQDGVLEADVHFDELVGKAREIGFSKIFFLPFPKVNSFVLTDAEYKKFQAGDNNILPFDKIRKDVSYFQTFILVKGAEVVDSRFPRDLRARMQLEGKAPTFKPGSLATYRVKIANCGETVWLSPIRETKHKRVEVHNGGGFIWLIGTIKDKSGRQVGDLTKWTPISRDVYPGHTIEMAFALETPKASGEYTLEIDMLLRAQYMFSDHHRNENFSESLKIPFKI